MTKVCLVITIDTECDKGPDWIIRQPMQFRSVETGIPEFLTPLFQSFNLKPTYLLSPEVIKNDGCVAALRNINQCELGTHLHGEFIEPFADSTSIRTDIPQLSYKPEIEYQKLRNLTVLFEDKFGYKPISFRAGRWGLSYHTLGFLEELGYKTDTSICPFRTHYFNDQKAVNFWGTPLQPYHPSERDYKRKGRMKILEVPATIGNPHFMNLPRFIMRQLNDKSRMHKRIMGKLGRSAKITMLRPFKSSAEEMIMISEVFIKTYRHKTKPVLLNMMFHSNEIIPGASPYVQSEKERAIYLDSMKILFEFLNSEYEVIGIGLSETEKYY